MTPLHKCKNSSKVVHQLLRSSQFFFVSQHYAEVTVIVMVKFAHEQLKRKAILYIKLHNVAMNK